MELWNSEDRTRWFLLPGTIGWPMGTVRIQGMFGKHADVDPFWLERFEITEEQARQWARDQLGQALGEVKSAVDEKVAEWRKKLEQFNQTPLGKDSGVTHEAASGLLDLLKQLPSVVCNGLSGDEQRVDAARNIMVGLRQRFKEYGINLGDEFGSFPDRLAALRRETEQELEAKKSGKEKNSPG